MITKRFLASGYLETFEDVSAYLLEALATEDRDFIASCVKDVMESPYIANKSKRVLRSGVTV